MRLHLPPFLLTLTSLWIIARSTSSMTHKANLPTNKPSNSTTKQSKSMPSLRKC
jgi:hypothetical protein